MRCATMRHCFREVQRLVPTPISANPEVTVLTTGGTIDKIYFDANSQFEVGSSVIDELMEQARVSLGVRVRELMRKDSLELTDADRDVVAQAVEDAETRAVIITHGTDTMDQTARRLANVPGKTIVLTGAFAPARFAATDAIFNIGMAFGAVQALPPGVYIAMSGQIFPGLRVRKNLQTMTFERIDDAQGEL